MRNREIARVLEAIADMLEIQGESPFRSSAYRKAARTLQDLTRAVPLLPSRLPTTRGDPQDRPSLFVAPKGPPTHNTR